jgi:hypothetical protein
LFFNLLENYFLLLEYVQWMLLDVLDERTNKVILRTRLKKIKVNYKHEWQVYSSTSSPILMEWRCRERGSNWEMVCPKFFGICGWLDFISWLRRGGGGGGGVRHLEPWSGLEVVVIVDIVAPSTWKTWDVLA